MDHHAALGCDMVLLLGLQGYDTSTELNVRIAHERRIFLRLNLAKGVTGRHFPGLPCVRCVCVGLIVGTMEE